MKIFFIKCTYHIININVLSFKIVTLPVKLKLMLWINYLHLFLISTTGISHHQMHLSVTSLDYSEADNEFSMTIKTISNDLKLAVFHNFNIDITGERTSIDSTKKKYINRYIDQHFTLSGKKRHELSFIGLEFDREHTWIKYKIHLKKVELKKISIKNSIFTDLYYDQRNLVIIKYKNFEKGFELDYSTNEISIDLNKVND